MLFQVALLQRAANEGARRVGLERRAGVELPGVLEEGDEELRLVDRRAQRVTGGARLDLAPRGAHFRPEGLRARVVLLAGAEVVVADALVARNAVFAAEIPAGGVRELEIVFLLHPALRRDGVAVGAHEDIVVLAHAELAARQGTPGVVADPGRHALGVLPAA